MLYGNRITITLAIGIAAKKAETNNGNIYIRYLYIRYLWISIDMGARERVLDIRIRSVVAAGPAERDFTDITKTRRPERTVFITTADIAEHDRNFGLRLRTL